MSIEFWVSVTLALGLGGFVKGATGMGLPLISIPALASFIGVPHALALMTIPIVVTNLWQAWLYLPYRSGTRFLLPFLPMAAIGTGLGTWALAKMPAALLSTVLASMIFLYIALHVLRPTLALPRLLGTRLSGPIGFLAGTLHGATGISGPISVTYLHALRLTRDEFVFATSVIFLLLGFVQVPALALAGLMDWARLLQGCIALIPVVAMMQVGSRASTLLSRQAFDRIILGVLAVMALKLLAQNF